MIRSFKKDGKGGLIIPVEEKTRKFTEQLLIYYRYVNFAFPFYTFSFGVSTGEMEFLSIFSDLYSMKYKTGNSLYTILKDQSSVLLMFDEADLSLHPRWQRQYMKWLTDFCEKLFDGMSVNIIIATHSPILLSDFPSNSVFYMKKNDEGVAQIFQRNRSTFASNIHSLYLDSFFLDQDGTIGAFAEDKINDIAQRLLEGKMQESELGDCGKIIEYIGEGIIRDKLQKMYDRYGTKKTEQKTSRKQENQDVLKDTIEKLKAQRNALDEMIVNLEKMNDQNND